MEEIKTDTTSVKTEETVIKITDYIICKKLVQLKQSAESRKIEFNLSFKTVKKLLLQKTCFYTGKPMTTTGPSARSIDRVDSSKGYFDDNVVACTTDINSKKTNLSVDEILLLAKNITKHSKSKIKTKK